VITGGEFKLQRLGVRRWLTDGRKKAIAMEEAMKLKMLVEHSAFISGRQLLLC